jgi:hypothetical protein
MASFSTDGIDSRSYASTDCATPQRSAHMALSEDIVKLLKSEDYRTNEAIRDALNDFLEIVTEENEEMEDGIEDDKDDDEDDEGPNGLKAER